MLFAALVLFAAAASGQQCSEELDVLTHQHIDLYNATIGHHYRISDDLKYLRAEIYELQNATAQMHEVLAMSVTTLRNATARENEVLATSVAALQNATAQRHEALVSSVAALQSATAQENEVLAAAVAALRDATAAAHTSVEALLLSVGNDVDAQAAQTRSFVRACTDELLAAFTQGAEALQASAATEHAEAQTRMELRLGALEQRLDGLRRVLELIAAEGGTARAAEQKHVGQTDKHEHIMIAALIMTVAVVLIIGAGGIVNRLCDNTASRDGARLHDALHEPGQELVLSP